MSIGLFHNTVSQADAATFFARAVPSPQRITGELLKGAAAIDGNVYRGPVEAIYRSTTAGDGSAVFLNGYFHDTGRNRGDAYRHTGSGIHLIFVPGNSDILSAQ